MVFNKSSLLKFGLALGISVPMFIASPLVFANSNSTVVRGNVYNESNGGKGIGGLTVTVQCFANKKKTRYCNNHQVLDSLKHPLIIPGRKGFVVFVLILNLLK